MPRKTYSGPSAEDKALEVWSDVLIDKLEHLSKDSKWEQPWFSKEGLAWPKNVSGRPYSGMNAVILKMLAEKNHYETPIWATFNRLTSLNYQQDPTKGPIPIKDKDGNELPRVMVNKGEKSTPVGLMVFTVINKDTKEKIPYEDYREMEPADQEKFSVYPKMAVYNVFNLSQTNIKEARPELYEKLKGQCEEQALTDNERKMYHLPELDAMIDEQKWICPVDIKDEDKCFYSISRNRVQMVPLEKFKSGEAFASNFWHEAAHSTLPLFNRFDPSKLDDKTYSKEEITAELTAALVASTKGLHKSVKTDSLPYIKSWLDNIKEDPRYIKSVLVDVKKASGVILDKLEVMRLELEQRKEQSGVQTGGDSSDRQDVEQKKDNSTEEVAAKAIPEQKQDEQEEQVVKRGFRR